MISRSVSSKRTCRSSSSNSSDEHAIVAAIVTMSDQHNTSEQTRASLGIAIAAPKPRVAFHPPATLARLLTPTPGLAGASGASGGGNTITDHSGRVLTQVRVKPIFWGTSWFHPQLHAGVAVSDVLWAIKTIFLGPFMSALNQYRGIGKGTLLSDIFVSLTDDPPNPFSQDQLENMLRSLTVLPDLRLVDPALDDQLLCIVFTPPGWRSTSEGTAGFHTSFSTSKGRVPYA